MTFTNYSVLCMLSCVLRHALQCGENSKSCEGLFPFSSALLRKSTKSCWVDVWLLSLHWGCTGPARVSLWILKVGTFLENRKFSSSRLIESLTHWNLFSGTVTNPLPYSLMDFNSELFAYIWKKKEFIILPDCCLQMHLRVCYLYLLLNVLVALFLLLLLLSANLVYPQRTKEDLFYKFTLELPSTKWWFCSQVSRVVMKGISHNTCEI